jgi:hypothetical protein
MKPLSFFGLSVSIVGASLFSSCASKPAKKDACCGTGGSAQAAVGSVSPAAAPQGSGKSTGPSSVRGSFESKVREHLTESTQHEAVREAKPVIGDDSDLRK